MMNSGLTRQLSVEEFCQSAELPVEYLLEIVECGILQPSGPTPAQWLFDASALAVAKRALRLRRDLEIEWAGIALALELMAELEQVRRENSHLKQRLSRFEQPQGESPAQRLRG